MKSKIFTISKNLLLLTLLLFFVFSCKNQTKSSEEDNVPKTDVKSPFFKLSLAQWSIHKAIQDEGMNPIDFAQKASELGFEGIEYVSQLYDKKLETMSMDVLLDSLKAKSDQYNMKNILIMVDHAGDLADPDSIKRNEAVENHKKWVDAASFLGCHSIRVNTFGTNDPEIWKETVVDGLKKLSTYAASKNINVICENHGWLSSDVPKLMKAIKAVNMPNCGTLPDFGNWCIKRNEGERWGDCIEEYPDMYEGIKAMMPVAKGVSAKSYDFDENGNETKIDYVKMLQIVKDAGFNGYIGVEYEGERLNEEEGIMATKKLLLNAAKQLN